MPCTPPKARHVLKAGKAKPKRNKLGLFYVQLTYEQEPDNQPLVVGIDPGSRFEGYSVVGARETVLNLMAEAPDHVKEAVAVRRTMRRVRRSRKWRRPCRSNNRLGRKNRIPPSRGTLVHHPRYGLCSVGGCDRVRGTISLHDYRTNTRLTKSAQVKDCQIKTAVASRSWLVSGHAKRGGRAIPPAP